MFDIMWQSFIINKVRRTLKYIWTYLENRSTKCIGSKPKLSPTISPFERYTTQFMKISGVQVRNVCTSKICIVVSKRIFLPQKATFVNFLYHTGKFRQRTTKCWGSIFE